MFAITAMDHIVLRVADVTRTIAFYRDVLGLPVEREAEWRAGRVGFPSVRISAGTLIDIIHGDPVPAAANMDHMCLVTSSPDLEPVMAHLSAHGVTVTTGPAKRWGAHGDAASIYFNDPDGNVIELRTYAPDALARLAPPR